MYFDKDRDTLFWMGMAGIFIDTIAWTYVSIYFNQKLLLLLLLVCVCVCVGVCICVCVRVCVNERE